MFGITGTVGAGENVRGTFTTRVLRFSMTQASRKSGRARPCQIFSEAIADVKISTRCTVSVRKGCGVPEAFLISTNNYPGV